MMRPAPHRSEKQATRHPSHFSLCPSNPGSDSPRGTLDRSPSMFPLAVPHVRGRPAPCFSDANCGGRVASCRHRQAVITRAPRSAGGRAGGACAPSGVSPNFSHATWLPATPPREKTQRLERSCSRRSLRLWHRRVALRAVGLREKKGRRKSHNCEILASSQIL